MRHVTVDLVRKANKRYVFNKKNNIPNVIPTTDIWDNILPAPPAFPFKFFKAEHKKEGGE